MPRFNCWISALRDSETPVTDSRAQVGGSPNSLRRLIFPIFRMSASSMVVLETVDPLVFNALALNVWRGICSFEAPSFWLPSI
jgi:hypothetical protein